MINQKSAKVHIRRSYVLKACKWEIDLTPDYVPHVIREFSTFCVVYCAGRGVAETEGIHVAANAAGVI